MCFVYFTILIYTGKPYFTYYTTNIINYKQNFLQGNLLQYLPECFLYMKN